jgi:hypothetical protein
MGLHEGYFSDVLFKFCNNLSLQMSIIVPFEQMKSGDFKDKSGKISD